GTVGANTSYDVTDFVPVEPSTVYARNYSHEIAFYDENKIYISGLSRLSPPEQASTITTPSNAKYIRATLSKGTAETFQLEKGNLVTAYEPFSYTIPYFKDEQIYGILDVVLPKKLYALLGSPSSIKPLSIYFNNVIKGNTSLINVDVDAPYGRQYKDRYHVEPGNSAIKEYSVSSGSYDVVIKLRDVNMKVIYSTKTNIEIVPLSSSNQVNLLCIGDSMTRLNSYAKQVQDVLPNVKTVGTRSFDNGITNGEGRGGWTVADYINNTGKTTTPDSPFLFPVGIDGEKFWGNTEVWKKICYTDSTGYDFDGFQKIAKGWDGASYLFDTNGYPTSPVSGDVVLDPSKQNGQQFLQYDGSTWQVMATQPTMEINFSKYMSRFAAAFGSNLPTHVSILLAANDFQLTEGIDNGIETYIKNIKAIVSSIKSYNQAIKIIINLPIIGNNQDFWAVSTATKGTSEMYRQNMQKVGRRLLTEFDTDAQMANGVYVCAMNANLDTVENMQDWVHPNPTGQLQLGSSLAALVQKTR
ncbi:hypothetical protein A2U94_19900, partial [Bacillus sp. VT 712]